MAIKEEVSLPKQGVCVRCNFVSSQAVCKACVLLEGLNKGLPRLGVGKSSKAKKMLEEYNAREKQNKENVPTDNKLDLALKELSLDDTDSNKKGSCISRKGKCRTGLCSSKNATLDSKTDDVSSCNNSGNTCCSSKEKTQANGEVANPKLDRLLEEYGLDDRSSSNDKQNDKDESDSEEPKLYNEEEENTCAGTCGSLQVGF